MYQNNSNPNLRVINKTDRIVKKFVSKFKWTIPQLDKLLNSKTILAQLERAS